MIAYLSTFYLNKPKFCFIGSLSCRIILNRSEFGLAVNRAKPWPFKARNEILISSHMAINQLLKQVH